MHGKPPWKLGLAGLAGLVAGLDALTATAEARPWTFSDIAAVRTVADVRLAPHGDRILYAVASTDPKDGDRLVWYVRSVGTCLAIGGVGADEDSVDGTVLMSAKSKTV